MARTYGNNFRAVLASVALLLLAAPVTSQQPRKLAALGQLQRGLWQLRDVETNKVSHAPVCVGSPKLLFQIEHRGKPCSHLVVSQDERSATVHYTCPAADFGQTLLKLETPRLAQIETQGIVNGAPFSYRLEARRVGTCSS